MPDAGGDTLFADQQAAYEALSPTMRSMIDGLTAIHSARRQYGEGGLSTKSKAMQTHGTDVAATTIEHPVVRTHPETGRKALYIGRRQNTYIPGLTVEESEDLLDAIWIHADTLGRNTFHHRWRPGDFVIWDNRCVMHRRDEFSADARRIMHRTQIRADAAPV